jgi:hypothetical protein
MATRAFSMSIAGPGAARTKPVIPLAASATETRSSSALLLPSLTVTVT